MSAINVVAVVVALTLAHSVMLSTQAAIEVTNEQLRDGLLSLAHSSSELGNTLERHEQRERALGEVVKRGLQALQKGQKIFEPMRGTFARLDERIGQLETFLLEKDEKFNEQQAKLNKVIDLIEKLGAGQEKQAGNADRLAELSSQVEDMSVNVKELRKEVASVASKHNELPNKVAESLTTLDTKLAGKLDENAAGIRKLQEQQQPAASNGAWEQAVSRDLQHIRENLESAIAGGNGKANDADHAGADQNLLISLNNRTLDAIADMRHEILAAADQNQLKTVAKLSETTALMAAGNGAQRNGADGSCQDVKLAIDDIKRDMQDLAKLEQMLALLGDGMLSMKRGQEFNVHKITSEVADAIKLNAIEMNDTINNQIKAINQTILANHNGAMANLTQKIETEISQVWRQIGIMYQEVSSSKDALNKLQELTEAYVNGTVSTMDSMEGKVSQITGRMGEVDANLNYLLGRLSLVTQEFNQIKNGLGSALDNIRTSFQLVQSKIQVVGPGPHKIESEENVEEPDIQLLPQRDQPAA